MSPFLAFLIHWISVAGSTFALAGFKFFFVKLNSQELIHRAGESFALGQDFLNHYNLARLVGIFSPGIFRDLNEPRISRCLRFPSTISVAEHVQLCAGGSSG